MLLLPVFITLFTVVVTGTPLSSTLFRDSVLTDTIPPKTADPAGEIFMKVDKEAGFPGGDMGWFNYLRKKLNPEVPITKNAPVGTYTVIVQFIVTKTGILTDMKALTHHGYGMEQEVLRVLRESPLWIPAEMNNKKVNAYRTQPVTFVVDEEKTKKKKKKNN